MIPVNSTSNNTNTVSSSSSSVRKLGEPSKSNICNSNSYINSIAISSRNDKGNKLNNDNNKDNKDDNDNKDGTGGSKKIELSSSSYVLLNREQEERRLNRIALAVLKTKQSHQLASKYFEQRQSYFVFIPLQLLATITAAVGIIFSAVSNNSTGVRNSNSNSNNVWMGLGLGFVGLLSLLVNSFSKRWDFDGKAKSHELVASHMRWLLDEIEMIHHYDEESDGSRHGEKLGQIESTFVTELRLCQNLLLPRPIEIAYEQLTVQLELMLRFSPSFIGGANGNTNGNGNGNNNNNNNGNSNIAIPGGGPDDDAGGGYNGNGNGNGNGNINNNSNNNGELYYLDDRSYYKIVRFAYSELAIVLGDSDDSWMIRLPQPTWAVQKTIHRLSNVLLSLRCGGDDNRNMNNNNNNNNDHQKLKTFFTRSSPPPSVFSFGGRLSRRTSMTNNNNNNNNNTVMVDSSSSSSFQQNRRVPVLTKAGPPKMPFKAGSDGNDDNDDDDDYYDETKREIEATVINESV